MKWQTLAPELIFEVFTQFRGDSKALSIIEPRSFPWCLGHICRTWREVFISSSQFWSTLDIDFDFRHDFTGLRGGQRDPKHELAVLEVARISMVRSRNYAISFKLSTIGYSHEISITCRQIIEILVASSARWRDARIDIPANEMATIYAAKNRMPLLRSIGLRLQNNFSDDNTISVRSMDVAKLYSDFLLDATQLTRICFRNSLKLIWKINWSLITVIYFYFTPPLSQLLAYLSQTASLMELVFFDACKRDRTSSDEIVPITLPHLKSLCSLAITPLQIVETPTLQELHIRNNICMIEDKSVLKAIISRYFQPICHLSKLEILVWHCEHAALIIEHMPRVDHLTLFSSTPDLLKILEDYPIIGFLKTVTFMLRTIKPDRSLKIITSWKRETGKNIGIGPFHNLTEMSFNLMHDHPAWFVDILGLHLEEQGMRYSIGGVPLDYYFPRFDVL